MASRRSEQQSEIQLKVMRLISEIPEMSSRQVADAVGISNGSAYYVLTALVEKGQQTMTNMNPTANLKVAAKSFNSLTGTAAEGLTTFRDKKDDEGLA